METSLWQRMQTIDRRVIYALLLLVIIVPILVPSLGGAVPIIPSQQSLDFYNTIEGLAKSDPERKKLVIVDGWWAAGTRGENQWQEQAILTHLMQRRIHFATLSFDPQNKTLTQNIAQNLAAKYHYVYGQDYVLWGYRPQFVPTLKGISSPNGLQEAIKTDQNGTPLGQIPVMKDIKDLKDIGAIIEITPTGSLGTWIGLVQGKYNTPLLYAPTAVMAPDAYPFLDSGQVSGLLTGVKGAGDYEQLTGTHTFGTRATGALSLVYALIIVFVILGNVGYHVGRAAARREGQ
ncbi:MAG: hypothetical protein JO250_21165 [Armatimonadetes bacterium]|nr:hypothetical protein [Armatimonadota bacterium]